MIFDIPGVALIPGNMGRDCPANGINHPGVCCCDECDYMLCCLEAYDPKLCEACKEWNCPHAKQKRT